MEETKETKETEGTRWRVGIVAPDCEPSFAIEPGTIRDEEVAAVAGKYSEMAPEGCFVFAFRSRSDSFDVRCAVLASLFAVHVGKGEYTARNLCTFYDDQFTSWKTRLAEQARTCIDLRGKLQDARRRVVTAVAAGLAIGVLLGGLAGFLLFSEHAPFRVADDHAQEERAGRAEDFPGGDRGPVRERGRLAPVALGLVGAAAREGDLVLGDDRRKHLLPVGERGVHGQKPGFAEFVKEPFPVGRVAGNGRAFAGGVTEDGELDVVHGAESTTGTDKLSAAAKGTE